MFELQYLVLKLNFGVIIIHSTRFQLFLSVLINGYGQDGKAILNGNNKTRLVVYNQENTINRLIRSYKGREQKLISLFLLLLLTSKHLFFV